MLRLHQEAMKLVEPEVVATSPYPGKNRMPVCCGFDSQNWCSWSDGLPKSYYLGAHKEMFASRNVIALTLATLSTSCLCWLGYTSKHLRPVSITGLAPAMRGRSSDARSKV